MYHDNSRLTVFLHLQDQSPLGYSYKCESVTPYKIALVPILRSGLSMIDAFTSLLPHPVPIHHLGLYREKSTMQPVEYYNKLHNHKSSTADPTQSSGPADLAIIVDPVIATGATACAAVESLRDWGVKKVIVCSVIASRGGLINVAKSWDGVEVFVGGCDAETDANGMIKPGLGDIGDRLFLTVGT